jgi:hypothetical protein
VDVSCVSTVDSFACMGDTERGIEEKKERRFDFEFCLPAFIY